MNMTANTRAPKTGTMLLDPEAAPRVTDGSWTLNEVVGTRAPIRYAKPARGAGQLTTITTMATLPFVVMPASPTPAPGTTAIALDVGTGVNDVPADHDLGESDFVPLRRPAPRWSIAIDPRTPLVASRKPFIPPSMLEIDDDERARPDTADDA